ncbi:MAG: hypothetical protein HOV87_15930 [Catenulispora sp.]|nr:hypothetical protein [Catenulispora sp.]
MTSVDSPYPAEGEEPHGEPPPQDDRAFFGQSKGLRTGCSTPNISAQVGDLHHDHDERRDAGFTVLVVAVALAIGAIAFATAPFVNRLMGDVR